MAITAAQRARIVEIAKERGLDVDELLAQAEDIVAKRVAPSGVDPGDKPDLSLGGRLPAKASPVAPANTTSEQPKLFQYHLPFVTVNEVRTKWLGLEKWDADQGGDDNAAAFSARQSGVVATSDATRSDSITHEGEKWIVWSSDKEKRLGEYDSEDAAKERLRQIEAAKEAAS